MSFFRTFDWMVAREGPAVDLRRRTAWRSLVLGGAGAALPFFLGGCGGTPRRRPSAAAGEDFTPEELDLAAAGPGSEVVMQALANVGKPYRWGGSDPGVGFDCSGLVAHVYEDAVGLRLPRTSREMSRRGRRVARRELAAGDLVFFNTSRRAYSHVGIYIGRDRFVHAPSSGSLVRVERMNNRYWAQRYDGARRLLATSRVPPSP